MPDPDPFDVVEAEVGGVDPFDAVESEQDRPGLVHEFDPIEITPGRDAAVGVPRVREATSEDASPADWHPEEIAHGVTFDPGSGATRTSGWSTAVELPAGVGDFLRDAVSAAPEALAGGAFLGPVGAAGMAAWDYFTNDEAREEDAAAAEMESRGLSRPPTIYDPGAVAAGAGQAMTLGHSDEIAGALDELAGGDYTEARDEARARDRAYQEDAPEEYLGGSILGAAPLIAAPGAASMASARGAGALETIGAASLEGGLLGGAYGAGTSEADVGTEEFARDTIGGGARGALASGAMAGVGEGIRAAAGPLGRHLSDVASEAQERADDFRIGQAIGHRNRGVVRGIARSRGGLTGAADDLRAEGIFGPTGLRGTRGVDRGIERMTSEGREGVARIAAEVGDAPVDLGTIRGRLERQLEALRRVPGAQARRDEITRVLREMDEVPDPTYADLRAWKNDWFIRSESGDDQAMQRMWRDLRGAAEEQMVGIADAARPGMGEELLRRNRQTFLGSTLEKAREEARNANAANSPVGLLAMTGIMGGGGAAAGGMVGGPIGGLVGTALAGTAASALQSRALHASMNETVARLLRQNPRALGQWANALAPYMQKGEQALAAAIYVATSRDPDLARTLREAQTTGDGPQENDDER